MAITKAHIDDPVLIIYYGTAAERAAMTTSGVVSTGSHFYESDTKLEYVWTGAGWVAWLLHTVA